MEQLFITVGYTTFALFILCFILAISDAIQNLFRIYVIRTAQFIITHYSELLDLGRRGLKHLYNEIIILGISVRNDVQHIRDDIHRMYSKLVISR